jgi:hypothetical protein
MDGNTMSKKNIINATVASFVFKSGQGWYESPVAPFMKCDRCWMKFYAGGSEPQSIWLKRLIGTDGAESWLLEIEANFGKTNASINRRLRISSKRQFKMDIDDAIAKGRELYRLIGGHLDESTERPPKALRTTRQEKTQAK